MSFKRLRRNYNNINNSQDMNSNYYNNNNNNNNNYNYNNYNNNNNINYNNNNNNNNYNNNNNNVAYSVHSNNSNYRPSLKRVRSSGCSEAESNSTTSSAAADQYICNNCINEALIKCRNNLNQPEQYYGESSNDVQDRLNVYNKNRINNQVQQRIQRSEEVAKNMGNGDLNKERLIRENENGVFYFNDDNQIGNDYLRQKALEKYRNQARYSSTGKSYFDKPAVDDYYRNYVDNYKIKEVENDYDKKLLQQKYNEELEKQIKENNRLKNKDKYELNRKIKAEQDEDNENYLRKQLELEKKRQLLNSEFLKDNENLMKLRNKRRLNEKNMDEYNEQKNQQMIQKKIEDEDYQKQLLENQKKLNLQKDLDNQLKERERRRALEKEKDKMNNYNNNNNYNVCMCDDTGKCCCCKKQYPMSFLNPRKQYSALARCIKNKKKNQKLQQQNQYKNNEA
jgi:hypothetical protein